MPITFRCCQPQQLTQQDQLDLAKLFDETECVTVTEGAFWVLANFNSRVVGAMLVSEKTKRSQLVYECEYLAVRKPTRGRGIGTDLVMRWSEQQSACLVAASSLPEEVVGFIKYRSDKK